MSGEFHQQYAQLLGLGVLWVSLHCAGMCGPIMAGLNSGVAPDATPRKQAMVRGQRVLSYQLGRGVMYGLLGALAGLIGVAMENAIRDVAMVSGLVVAAGLFASGVAQLPPVAERLAKSRFGAGSMGSQMVGKLLKGLRKRWPAKLPGRMVALGFVMGLLPCMLMFWVLGLAASTASPLHGAALMGGLVLMTTPVLLFAGTAPLLANPALRRFGQRALPVAIMLSGLWLGLISAAANGWVEHAWFNFNAWGKDYTLMFW